MSNEPKIRADMTVLDVVHKYRRTEEVFRRCEAQAGACILCEALFETLADIAATYGLSLQDLLESLERAAADGP